MKQYILLIGLLITMISCGSYNSIDAFYEAHKDESQVTAVRVPRFMFTLLGGISPEVNSLIGNTKDVRYMEFPSATPERAAYLNREMGAITSNSFIEVFRNNDKDERKVISMRERKDVVKEILIYTNTASKGSFLYFKGNFNPVKVRDMVQNRDFDTIGKSLLSQYTRASK